MEANTAIGNQQRQHGSNALTTARAESMPPQLQLQWALKQVRKMESVKRGAEMEDEPRAWLAGKIAKLAAEHGYDAVDRAIEHCLENCPFRPDIAEIRAALGATAAQMQKASEDVEAVKAAEAWTRLEAHVKRYGTNDEHGTYKLRCDDWRVVRDAAGRPVMATGPKGYPVVRQEPVPVPALPERTAWCMEQIGGLARVMGTPDKYRDVVRRDFLKTWALYTSALPALQIAEHPEVSQMIAKAAATSRVM